MAGKLSAAGISPNTISAFSVVLAACGGAAYLAAGEQIPWTAGWVAGAICIQLRLICNLMDGMVAIEGGQKSATGDLWNEIPDRLADGIFLMCAAWAVGLPWVGALAGWAAVMTAYVRAMGASLTGIQDYCGPFAKPHRMAALTVASLLTAFEPAMGGILSRGEIMRFALYLIAAGTCVTIFRRTRRLAARLKEARP